MLDLRPARLDDATVLQLVEEVQDWYVEIYGGRDDDPIEPDEFVAPHGGFLLGTHEGEPVAMGGWSFLPGSRDAVKIRRMYVRPAVRRLGYAATLLDRLEADARAAGASRVALTTGSPQVAAIRFYRARGYTDVEPFGFYAASPGAIHLGKPLEAPEGARFGAG
jgi:GNAT superfamily N-acetyltransferase